MVVLNKLFKSEGRGKMTLKNKKISSGVFVKYAVFNIALVLAITAGIGLFVNYYIEREYNGEVVKVQRNAVG